LPLSTPIISEQGEIESYGVSKSENGSQSGLDPEVKPRRKALTAQYKREILEEIDAAPSGKKGEIVRREGLWSSQISDWRKERKAGTLQNSKRGRKAKDPFISEIEQLRAENEKLKEQLGVAEQIMEAQGKVSALLQEMSRKSASKN
jgi:transposase